MANRLLEPQPVPLYSTVKNQEFGQFPVLKSTILQLLFDVVWDMHDNGIGKMLFIFNISNVDLSHTIIVSIRIAKQVAF